MTPVNPLRGGGWNSPVPTGVRAKVRSPVTLAIREHDLGFRTTLAGRQPR